MSSQNPIAIATFVTTVAVAIAENQTSEGIALLAAVFTQLGDTLATMLTAMSNG